MTTVTNFTDGEDVDAFMLNSRIQALLSSILNPAAVAVSATDAADGATSAVSYTSTLTGASTLSVNFTCPPSGKVLVSVGCAFYAAASANVFMSFALSGASTRAAADVDSCHVFSNNNIYPGSRTVLCTGLVAGGSYTATCQHKVSASTGHWLERSIVVVPVWPLA